MILTGSVGTLFDGGGHGLRVEADQCVHRRNDKKVGAEHQDACRKGDERNSAVTEHSCKEHLIQ